jgi:hypothetical protein
MTHAAKLEMGELFKERYIYRISFVMMTITRDKRIKGLFRIAP